MSVKDDDTSPPGIIEEEVGDDLEVVDASEAVGGVQEDDDEDDDSQSEEEEYEVEAIIQSRFVKKKKQYLVKWVNYSDEWNTWEPMENLEGSQDLVDTYERKEVDKQQKEIYEKKASQERRKAAKEQKEAARAEREAKRKGKGTEKDLKKSLLKVEAKKHPNDKKKSKAVISSESDSDSESTAPPAKQLTEESDEHRRKKERKFEAKRKALKEKNEFRRMELESEKRKSITNAYKNRESGKVSSGMDVTPPPEAPVEITSQRERADTKSENEVTMRFLFGTDKESYEWQLPRVAEEFSRNKLVKIQKKVKCNIINSKEYTNIPDEDKKTFSHFECLVELTGAAQNISAVINDVFKDLTSIKKNIHKFKKNNDRLLIMNVVVRKEFWEVVFGKGDINFQDFRKNCYSKLASGLDLPDSTEKVVKVEGQYAGISLCAKRIALKLAVNYGSNLKHANAEEYQPYQPRCFIDDACQVVYLRAQMEMAPEESRLSILSTITSGTCEVKKAPEEEDGEGGGYNFILSGQSRCISNMKYYLVEDKVMTGHNLSSNELNLVKIEKEKTDGEKESDEAISGQDESCFYNLEKVKCDKSVVIYGLVGQPSDDPLRDYMSQFGDVEAVSYPSENSDFTPIVKFAETGSALAALKKKDQVFASINVLVVPYRYGDDESSRIRRTVIIDGLPKMTDENFFRRFQENGVVLARIWPSDPSVGIIVLSSSNMATRMERTSPLLLQADFHDEDNKNRKVQASTFLTRLFSINFSENDRLSILEDLELTRTEETDSQRVKSIHWREPDKLPKRPDHPKRPAEPQMKIAKKQRPAPKPAPPPAPSNLLNNLMSQSSIETNENTLKQRREKLNHYKTSEDYILFLNYADKIDRDTIKVPDHQLIYMKERTFFNKAFEWKCSIETWATDFRRRQRGSPPPEANDITEAPWDPANDVPLDDSFDDIPPEQISSPPSTYISSPSCQPQAPKTPLVQSHLMPQRRRGAKSNNSLTNEQLKRVNLTGNLAATLKALGQNKNIIDNLNNQEPEEPEIDPKDSLAANPPLEIRKILRKLGLERSDLETLLRIPLKVMTEHNVLALVDDKHPDRDHVGEKDPAKLISIVRVYLTPPDEADSNSKPSPVSDSPKPIDEDEIYKCLEFREILSSSLDLLSRGQVLMTELYDHNSIELEAGADF